MTVMASELLNFLGAASVASSCGILLTLSLRRQVRTFFGPSLAYFLWLLNPTTLLALLLPAPSAGLKAGLPVPLSMPSLTSHLERVFMSSGINWSMWLLCTWAMGVLLFCLSLARQQQQFVASLGVLIRSNGDVLRAAHPAACPVVIGVRRPRIVVPNDFDIRYTPEERALILAHERMHIRRGDLVINAACALARCIFWFNPLIHIAGRLVRFDQELACDAAVMRNHPHSRKPYASAMLRTQLADGALPLGCHWPSSHPLKERIVLLKQPPARGIRRAIGQMLVGTCVLMVGYATWASQSVAVAAGNGDRRQFADPQIRISSDDAQELGNMVRYTGHVIVEVIGGSGTVNFRADKTTRVDSPADGQNPNGVRSGTLLFEGHVQIEVGGRIFKTERAAVSKKIITMDTVDVFRDASRNATLDR